jgi:hypothetical protein
MKDVKAGTHHLTQGEKLQPAQKPLISNDGDLQ